jgi:hypothetical protein
METAIDGAERFFDGMGLMTGSMAIPKRMMIGGLVGAFLVTYFKPSAMFEAGKPRPWSMFGGSDKGPETTLIPWWSVPALGAFIGGVLI